MPTPAAAVVTGASGWLGQNLVRALAKQRARVRCLVHAPEEAPLLEVVGNRVEIVVGDVRDPGAIDRLFEAVGPAGVFHAAAAIHPQRATREFFDVNVGGTELVLDRARRAGAARVVHVSSNSPFGANATPSDRFTEASPYAPYMGYGRSKMEAEQLVLRSHQRGDVPSVIIRAPWFYGPFQPARQTRWFAAVRRGRFPLIGLGDNRRSLVYTASLVDALLRAEVVEGAAGRSYWVADPEPYEMREVLSTVRAALEAEGLPASRRQPRVPVAVGQVAARLDGLLQQRGLYMQALHVLGEVKDTIACDISRARAELGYEPATNLLDGMRASVRWCLERGERL